MSNKPYTKCKRCEYADVHVGGWLFCTKTYMYNDSDDWYFVKNCKKYKRFRVIYCLNWLILKFKQYKRRWKN